MQAEPPAPGSLEWAKAQNLDGMQKAAANLRELGLPGQADQVEAEIHRARTIRRAHERPGVTVQRLRRERVRLVRQLQTQQDALRLAEGALETARAQFEQATQDHGQLHRQVQDTMDQVRKADQAHREAEVHREAEASKPAPGQPSATGPEDPGQYLQLLDLGLEALGQLVVAQTGVSQEAVAALAIQVRNRITTPGGATLPAPGGAQTHPDAEMASKASARTKDRDRATARPKLAPRSGTGVLTRHLKKSGKHVWADPRDGDERESAPDLTGSEYASLPGHDTYRLDVGEDDDGDLEGDLLMGDDQLLDALQTTLGVETYPVA